MEQKKNTGIGSGRTSDDLPRGKQGGRTPVTFSEDAIEHQESNGDVNTTPSGNYLKEEGLAEYDESAAGKSADVERESPADLSRIPSGTSSERKDVSP